MSDDMFTPPPPPPPNPFLGYTQIRCNGGDPIIMRPTVRLVGMAVEDDRARARSVVTPGTVEDRITLIVSSVEAGDYWVNSPAHDAWFGFSIAFDEADDLLVTASADGVRFAGFSPPLMHEASRTRKLLVNAGEAAFEVRNFRFDDDAGDYDDPGMVQGHYRVLGPGESCRLQWDPVGQRWLVNDGLVSAEIITWDLEPVTFDGDQVTHPDA